MKVSDVLLSLLAECKVEGDTLFLPDRQLDRPTYLALNKVLEAMGGKWNRKAKGHIFSHGDPSALLESVVLTGDVIDAKKTFQFFPTPRAIAERLCAWADLNCDSVVLEPSCGRGDLADVIYENGVKSLDCVELNSDMQKYLADKPYPVSLGTDFLEFAKEHRADSKWTRIVMNPPFSKQQDIDHIMAAYDLLLPGGILASVVSASPFFRSDAKSEQFRFFLFSVKAEVVELDEGAFKESGTMVRANLLRIHKQ